MSYDEQEFYDPDEWDELVERFAEPGGGSALHAASAWDPRVHPCPNCGDENLLTERDVQAGYQCDRCADALEGGYS